jgi:hypothetical protein
MKKSNAVNPSASETSHRQAQYYRTRIPESRNAHPVPSRYVSAPMERGNGSHQPHYSPINRWYLEDRRTEPYHGMSYSSTASAQHESHRVATTSRRGEFEVSHAGAWIVDSTRYVL